MKLLVTENYLLDWLLTPIRSKENFPTLTFKPLLKIPQPLIVGGMYYVHSLNFFSNKEDILQNLKIKCWHNFYKHGIIPLVIPREPIVSIPPFLKGEGVEKFEDVLKGGLKNFI